jgi:hypothetical protein
MRGRWAEATARCCGRLSVDLGIRDRPDEVEAEVHALVHEPVAWWESHPNWPSSMAAVGPPVELSLRLDWRKTPALRVVVDVTDHRTDFAGNWKRYVAYAHSVVDGAADDDGIWQLCQSQLSGMFPESRSRMFHGIGYGTGGARRSTLYFRHTLDREPAVERLLNRSGVPDAEVELIGYDFPRKPPDGVKLYCPLSMGRIAAMLGEIDTSDRSLGAARVLFDTFGDMARASTAGGDVHIVQVSGNTFTYALKLFFPCATWGWSAADGLRRLLAHLGDLGVDLDPLGCFFDRLIAEEITVLPTVVAVTGASEAPSVTFYISPVSEHAPLRTDRPTRASGRMVEAAIAAGLDYLADRQDADGMWRDYDVKRGIDRNGGRCLVQGAATSFATAYIADCLADIPAAREMLHRAASALLARWRPTEGWGWNEHAAPDAETTALGVAVVHTAGLSLPTDAAEALLTHRGPNGGFCACGTRAVVEEGLAAADVTASVIPALRLVENGAKWLQPALEELTAAQLGNGRWRSVWWSTDLVATTRAVIALTRACSGPDAAEPMHASVARAVGALLAWPVPDDPFELGLWLWGWRAVDGTFEWTSAARAIACLSATQRPNGCWRGSSQRHVPRARPRRGTLPPEWDAATAIIDGRSLVTTATVLRGLTSTYRPS